MISKNFGANLTKFLPLGGLQNEQRIGGKLKVHRHWKGDGRDT